MANIPSDKTLILRALSDYASERIPEVVEALELDLIAGGRDYNGPCPVHGGDNVTALHLYTDGYSRKGNWFCATHNCQEHFGKDFFGFIRGVLSRKAHAWQETGDARVSLDEAQHWICAHFDLDPKSLLDPSAERKRSDEINQWSRRVERTSTPPAGKMKREGVWTRQEVRRGLKVPSPYFLSRGFSPELLDRYDIGEPLRANPQSPMFGRAVVPVYDLQGQDCIGFTGRCIEPDGSPKWHNHGFASGTTLWNIWNSKEAIKKLKKVVLVEGPGDCLRLVQAGVPNVVSMMGVKLGDAQQILLELMGCLEVVLLLDFDEAGRKAVKDLKRSVGRSFRVTVPEWQPLESKDVGGATLDELKQLVEMLT